MPTDALHVPLCHSDGPSFCRRHHPVLFLLAAGTCAALRVAQLPVRHRGASRTPHATDGAGAAQVHPSRHGTYDGISMNPYEVVFLKASWHVGEPFADKYALWRTRILRGQSSTAGAFDEPMYRYAIQCATSPPAFRQPSTPRIQPLMLLAHESSWNVLLRSGGFTAPHIKGDRTWRLHTYMHAHPDHVPSTAHRTAAPQRGSTSIPALRRHRNTWTSGGSDCSYTHGCTHLCRPLVLRCLL